MGTTKQPLITVVIPNYNGHRFVEQAIDSVLHQTYPNFELLVVDDCSKDDSLSLIQQKAQSDNRIKVIALEHNVGVANARNVGIKEAGGEYIALLDNDDLWTEDKLERQLALAGNSADIVTALMTLSMSKTTPLRSLLSFRSRRTLIKCWHQALLAAQRALSRRN